MKKEQYMIGESNKEKREEFYNYIMSTYQLKVHDSKKEMINSKFPFVVDFKKKDFWICTSITCCAMATQNNKIITIEEFKSL